MRLLLLLVVTPIIELYLLVKMSEFTGWGFTILLTIVTGIVGSRLAKQQGWATFKRIQRETSSGKMPTDALVDAFMILAAGLLLMTPGVLTDVFGFSLLVPFCRRVYRGWLMHWFKHHVTVQTFGSQSFTASYRSSQSNGDDDVIDSYVVDKRDDM
ncbi:MAG: FxsA family protein [Planctomycetales bacterium]|nr:FxsA family protein [Planctomycetales bacterium]